MSKNNQNYGTLQVGSTTYPLQKTTVSSILAISEEIDRIPVVMAKSNDDIVSSTFRNALLYREASSVIAVGMTKTRLIYESRITHWIFQHIVRRKAKMLNVRHTSIELNEAAQRFFEIISPEIVAFHTLTASLAGINMTKPTKSEEPTASEQHPE